MFKKNIIKEKNYSEVNDMKYNKVRNSRCVTYYGDLLKLQYFAKSPMTSSCPRRIVNYVVNANFCSIQGHTGVKNLSATNSYLLGKKLAVQAALAAKGKKYNFSDIILHHGSNQDFTQFDLSKSNRSLDFGPGIYAGTERHAKSVAFRKADRQKGTTPFLYTFKLSTDLLKKLGCKIKVFDSANQEWLDYVLQNRLGIYQGEPYDLVEGATLDGNIKAVLDDYKRGKPNGLILYDSQPTVYPQQIAFKTPKSLQAIHSLIQHSLEEEYRRRRK